MLNADTVMANLDDPEWTEEEIRAARRVARAHDRNIRALEKALADLKVWFGMRGYDYIDLLDKNPKRVAQILRRKDAA